MARDITNFGYRRITFRLAAAGRQDHETKTREHPRHPT
jgi:hypothetical protein